MRVKIEFETEGIQDPENNGSYQFLIDSPKDFALYKANVFSYGNGKFWIDPQFVTEIVEPFEEGDIATTNHGQNGYPQVAVRLPSYWLLTGSSLPCDDDFIQELIDNHGWTLIKNPSAV